MNRSSALFGMIFAIFFMMGMAQTAHAVPVVSYTNSYDSTTNLWTYESTITNDTPDLLYDFVIFPTAQPLSGADQTAMGWGPADVGNLSPYFVHWMGDFGAEILPGDTLGGFWFTYSGDGNGDIGPLNYSVTLWDLVNDSPYTFDGSTIASSTAVPEPATLIFMVVGMAGIAILKIQRRRRGVSIG